MLHHNKRTQQEIKQSDMVSKRKRSSSAVGGDVPSSSLPSHLPTDSINPFSYSPGQLLQFSIAGLSETDKEPSLKIANFPHRGLGRDGKDLLEDEEDGNNDEAAKEEDGGRRQKGGRPVSRCERQVQTLIQSIYHFLDRGDVPKAARVYGLVLQLQPHGSPIDIRHYNLWALGAEIIMRGGETAPPVEGDEGGEATQVRQPTRWGRAANMNKLKAYFETLIQQYPWDHRRPQNLSAIDFWLAILSCEVYNIHAEHVIGLARAEEEALNWDDDSLPPREEEEEDEEEYDLQKRREARLDDLRDDARKKSLTAMRDIAARMDSLIKEQPFSKTRAFFGLRATVSMYVADLVVPVVPASPFALRQAQDTRQAQLDAARAYLDKVIKLGGELDRPTMAFLGAGDDENSFPEVPLYSSLPIREP
ncbi:RNA polymerase I specific initiation factor [Geosmithia morbida]|uniref:RNA polymerase I specific initiation factor n=1 Tax=Geosmithia morbida TaxID=1094350 RepID=A0A9P5D896_9HYPO|nr:RNA polymerase I specific initiation factor [Geosmithia morbida]KAF4125299.1 RNA polymerase I specific initiation factor [Geosmithia morbida]